MSHAVTAERPKPASVCNLVTRACPLLLFTQPRAIPVLVSYKDKAGFMYGQFLSPFTALTAVVVLSTGTQAVAQGSSAPMQTTPATQAYYNAVSFVQNNPIQVGGARLVMQSDGNFVMYYPGGSWSTLTAGHDCSQGCHAEFQTDGNLVLYNGTSWFWASRTNGKGTFLLLSDYAPYVSIIGPPWSTVWAAVPSFNDLSLPQNASVLFNGRTLTMQGDGNLVLHNDLGVPVWDLGTAGQACGDSGCAAYVVGGQLDVYAGSNLIYQSPAGGLSLTTDQPYVRVGGTPIGHITDAGCISTQDQRNVVINTLIDLQNFSTKFASPSPTRNDLASCINGINTQVNVAASQQWTCTATGAIIFLEETCGIQLRADLMQNTSPGTGGIQKDAGGFILVGPDGKPVPTIIWEQNVVINSAAGLYGEFVTAAGQLMNSSYNIPGLSIWSLNASDSSFLSDPAGGSIEASQYGPPSSASETYGGVMAVDKNGMITRLTQTLDPGGLAAASQRLDDQEGNGTRELPWYGNPPETEAGRPYAPGDLIPDLMPRPGEQPAP